MATLFPPAAGDTEITLLVTVPEAVFSFSWYTQVFPTVTGNKAVPTVPLPFELAPFEVGPAEAEPAAAGWPEAELDVDAVVALELFPQPARTSPEAAAAASTAVAAGVRVMKPDLFMSCLGLGARRQGAAGRPRDG
jgi:hypothetical protein